MTAIEDWEDERVMTGRSTAQLSGSEHWSYAWYFRLAYAGVGIVACLVSDWLSAQVALLALLALPGYFIGGVLFALASMGYVDEIWQSIEAPEKMTDDAATVLAFLGGIVAVLMIWIDWWWFAGIAAVCSFAGPVPTYPPAWWRKAYAASIGVIILVQLWLNTGLIHMMGSGESLLDNSHVETQAPLLASLAFGVAVARWVSLRGPNRVVVFVLASIVFFHGQKMAVDAWAETRPESVQRDALASLMLASRLSRLGDPTVLTSTDNTFQATIKTALTPGWLTLTGYPDQYQSLAERGNEILDEQREKLQDFRTYKRIQPIFDNLKGFYSAYLRTELSTLQSEQLAQQLARENYPPLAGRKEPLTRSAIAESLLNKLWTEAPSRYRSESGMQRLLNHWRGREELEKRLAVHGLALPNGWRYESRNQMKGLIMDAVDRRVDDVRNQLDGRGGDPEALATTVARGVQLMTWETFTEAAIGMKLPLPLTEGESYTYDIYLEDIKQLFASNNDLNLAQGLYSLLGGGSQGTLVKAAVMPMVGIFVSFAFLMYVTSMGVIYITSKGAQWFFVPRKAWAKYEEDCQNHGVRTMQHHLITIGVYSRFPWYARHWIPFRIELKRRFAWIANPTTRERRRLGVMLVALLGLHVLVAGYETAFLQWQQVPFAIVTVSLRLLGIEPGFPVFLPAFLQ